MEWYEEEVGRLERGAVRAAAGSAPVVFYGGSSIRLWETLDADFPATKVLNLGFGGSTMAACSWFFWRLVRPVSPAALILYAGDNDLSDGRSPEDVLEQFRHLGFQMAMVNPEASIVYLSIKVSPIRVPIREKIDRTNQLIREELKRSSGTYVDVGGPLLDSAGKPASRYFLPDGLHLSAAGYARWTSILSQEVGFLTPSKKDVA